MMRQRDTELRNQSRDKGRDTKELSERHTIYDEKALTQGKELPSPANGPLTAHSPQLT